MTNVYGDLGFWFMARSRMLLGVGLPLIFVPILAASYDGIPQSKTDQASALINAARNTGGSIGVSIVSNVLTHREQFHQSRFGEQVIPSSAQYQDTLQQIMSFLPPTVARWRKRTIRPSSGSDRRYGHRRRSWPIWMRSGCSC